MPLNQLNVAPEGAPPPTPSQSKSSFTVSARPDTDIWRKPPSTFSFNAPILYTSLKLSDFKLARVTINGPWKALFDQGGLCLYMPQDGEDNRSWKWVKTGIEFYNGKPHIGTVACEKWADWSLVELEGNELTVEVEREVEDGKKTSSLWVYAVGKDGKRLPLREITWVFESLVKEVQSEQQRLCVGVYVARPKMDEDDHGARLEVSFKDLRIEAWDGKLEF